VLFTATEPPYKVVVELSDTYIILTDGKTVWYEKCTNDTVVTSVEVNRSLRCFRGSSSGVIWRVGIACSDLD